MERLTELLSKLTEEQLTAMTLIFSGLTVVGLFIFAAIWISSADAQEGIAVAFTPTPRVVATLPPTWTPTPSPSATATETPRPPTATPTKVPPSPSPSETPDLAATEAAAASPTPLPPTAEPPPSPQPPPPAPPPPTSPPPPPPPPTATPTPPYILQQMLGGPGCDGVKAFGTVFNQDGSPRAGVAIKMFNDYGYVQTTITDSSGQWEIFLRPDPDPSLAGDWHWEVIENNVPLSPQITFTMSGQCGNGPHAFQLDFRRTIP